MQTKNHLSIKVREKTLERVRSGLPSGCPPGGYTSNTKGEPVQDPAQRWLYRELFVRLANPEEPARTVLRELNGRGMRSRNGRPVPFSSLRPLLSNPFYCGYVRYEGETHPGRHLAIVSREEFNAVQKRLGLPLL